MLAPIPITYTELLPLLLKDKLLEIVPLKPLEPPYPRSYDPNARCNYHGGTIGHTTERCWRLKHKGPNVQNNPLPTNGGVTINPISHENRDEGSQRAELEGASRRGRGESEIGCAAGSANQVEEESHQSWPGQTESNLVAYVGGITKENPVLKVINIARTGGVTRSERIFAPKGLRNMGTVIGQ
ncbi:hypothetical protein CR513_46643, partial [Mucuna pruriens]